MSLFNILPWNEARKFKKQEETQNDIKNLEKEGCAEIYHSIIQDIFETRGKNLGDILTSAPSFNMDLTCGGDTLLTLIARITPNLPVQTMELILERKPNPFLCNRYGKTAQDVLKERYDFKCGVTGHKMYDILETYKIKYAQEKRENDSTFQAESPVAHQSLPLPKEKGRELGD